MPPTASVSPGHEQLLRTAYDAFNARDLDAALATMAPDVDWPNAFEGGRVHGRDAVRAYWTRQFEQIHSRVEPRRFRPRDDNDQPDTTRIAVDVHQVVKDAQGHLLSDTCVVHEYVVRDDLVTRMDVLAPPTHRYLAGVAWAGSTADGYDAYTRAHEGDAPTQTPRSRSRPTPPSAATPPSSTPSSCSCSHASSCQLLSFLAVAARARFDVIAYEDDAEGVMPESERPMRIVQIVLRPRITVRGEAPDDVRLRQLAETAHRHCFIANSLSTEIVLEPSFVRVPG